MHGLRLAGKIMIGVYDDTTGVRGSIFAGGNTTELTLAAEGEDVEILSTDYANQGAALDSMSDPKPTTGTWKINRFTYQTLALACAGVATALSAAESAAIPTTVTAVLGGGHLLDDDPINTVVVKNEAESTTYVLNTDYEVNEELAVLTPKIGGSITAGQVLHVTHKASAKTGYEIAGSTALGKKIWRGLDGRNLMTGQKVRLIIEKLKLKPSGTIGFIQSGSDVAEQQFDFTCIVPEGATAAYKLRVLE